MITKLLSKQSPIHLLMLELTDMNNYIGGLSHDLPWSGPSPPSARNITLPLLYYIPMVPSMLPAPSPSDLFTLSSECAMRDGWCKPFHVSET